jgi:hypothetical protein
MPKTIFIEKDIIGKDIINICIGAIAISAIIGAGLGIMEVLSFLFIKQ